MSANAGSPGDISMSPEAADSLLFQDETSVPTMTYDAIRGYPFAMQRHRQHSPTENGEVARGPRRTPRRSIVVVLPENHVLAPEVVTDSLATGGDNEAVDVIVACAGQPLNIAALKRKVRDLQVLLAPAGTGTEELRELAIHEAPGDIVTLLSGIPA
jgi:hypothetical protein